MLTPKKNEQVCRNIRYSEANPLVSEYEQFFFAECDFTEYDLSNTKFIDCRFSNCNFSNTKVHNTLFNNIEFFDCKIIGVDFSECNPFTVSLYFERCRMEMVSFYQLKLNGIMFNECNIYDSDFTRTDLTNAIFKECDLRDTIFERTTLKKADLRSTVNYSIDPDKNSITSAKFSIYGLVGLLNKHNIIIE